VINQYVWVGISVGVFIAGIGIGYAVFSPSFGPGNMMMQNQQMMQTMMQDPQQMQQMMQDPQFRQQMIKHMSTMMNDPEQRQLMMNMMMQNQEFMQEMMQDSQMMDMMKNMMGPGGMMGSWMQGQDMMSPVTDYVSLIDQLRKSGANVEPAGTIDQPFFSVVGKSILVNGENVQVFEYSTQAEAEEDASNVSPDGHSIGLSMPLWVEAPHFYQKEKIDDPSTIALLESILGTQFAGR